MTLSIADNGDGTHTMAWEITADSAKILDTAADAGQYIYPIRWQLFDVSDPPEPRPWSDLSNAEKLAVVNKELKYVVKEQARSFYIGDARDTAGETATGEADARYDI